MDSTTRTGTALRQRMIDDMRMRKLEPRTQEGYIRAVRKLAAFLKRPPDTATVEELRNCQRSAYTGHLRVGIFRTPEPAGNSGQSRHIPATAESA